MRGIEMRKRGMETWRERKMGKRVKGRVKGGEGSERYVKRNEEERE
jgi:hypothetical protein